MKVRVEYSTDSTGENWETVVVSVSDEKYGRLKSVACTDQVLMDELFTELRGMIEGLYSFELVDILDGPMFFF